MFSKRGIVKVVAVIPLVWSLGLLGFVLRAKEHLGHWPSPHTPDPKDLPFPDLHSIIFNGIYVVLAGAPLFLVLALAFRKHTNRRPLYVFAFGWALILAMTFFPPINFVMWILD